MSMLYRVEKYEDADNHHRPGVLMSFETKYRGYWQCWCYGGDHLYPAKDEPDIEMLTRAEQEEVRKVAPIVWRMVYLHKS